MIPSLRGRGGRLHDPRLGGLAAERERRQRLGADVEGEQLQDRQRQRDRSAGRARRRRTGVTSGVAWAKM